MIAGAGGQCDGRWSPAGVTMTIAQTRRRFVVASAAAAFSVAALSPAAAASRKWRLGLLGDAPDSFWDALRQGLRAMNYAEGRDLDLDFARAEGEFDRFQALADQLVNRKNDLIVAAGITATLAAKRATASLPIIMVIGSDPVQAGLVASVARPGGNITGFTAVNSALSPKRLELLREALPGIGKIAILANATSASFGASVAEVETAAKNIGIAVHVQGIRNEADLETAFPAMRAAGAGAAVILPSTLLFRLRERIAGLARDSLLPTMSPDRDFVEAGGLMSYAPSYPAMYRRAAVYADLILKGKKPAELPVEQPTTFELAINQKAAGALRLTIPESILRRADEVIL